jgi:hypothetical protein
MLHAGLGGYPQVLGLAGVDGHRASAT